MGCISMEGYLPINQPYPALKVRVPPPGVNINLSEHQIITIFKNHLNHDIMVTVKSFQKRQSKDGREFLTLELMGGLEMVQSHNTGKFYATVRKCSIPATFDEDVAASLIGTQMPGQIVRIPSDPYEYTIKQTGEVITLQRSYGYQPTPTGEVVHERELIEA